MDRRERQAQLTELVESVGPTLGGVTCLHIMVMDATGCVGALWGDPDEALELAKTLRKAADDLVVQFERALRGHDC